MSEIHSSCPRKEIFKMNPYERRKMKNTENRLPRIEISLLGISAIALAGIPCIVPIQTEKHGSLACTILARC